ncbi:MAG: alpha/beta fold hydrolase [Cyanobacteria bacterium P01_H01_bin.15]
MPIKLLQWLAVPLALSLLYGGLCLFIYLRQRWIIFLPEQIVELTPEDLKLDYETVWLPVGDRNEQIHGWWLPHPEPQGAVLYLHGNGGNVGSYVARASVLQEAGFSVFLFDYRGYGLSKGRFPNEQRIYEDARTALDYLHREQQFSHEQILLVAHSLGGAVAIELAQSYQKIHGLVVEGTFTSMRAMGQQKLIYRYFPVTWILTQHFDSLTKISALRSPIFFIHGQADNTVPADMSERLYQAALEPKKLWLIPDAGHNDLPSIIGPDYGKAIRAFYEQNRLTPSLLSTPGAKPK